MTVLERRIFTRGLLAASIVTLAVLAADAAGVLRPLDNWLSDLRSAYCQVFTPTPSNKIVFLDIDDGAIDALGRWPWPRMTMGRMLQELALAKPKVVGLDVILSEAEAAPSSGGPGAGPSPAVGTGDATLASALHDMDVVSALDFLPRQTLSQEEVAARDVLQANLELSATQLREALAQRSLAQSMTDHEFQDLFLAQRRAAAQERVRQAMDAGVRTRAALASSLFPHVDATLNAPEMILLDDVLGKVLTERGIRRFAMAETPAQAAKAGVKPLQVRLNLAPLPIFADAATTGGFVNYEFFHEPTVRYVPMAVDFDGLLYPQMGLQIGCAMMGADLSRVELSRGEVRVPIRGSADLRIPVRDYYSSRLSQGVPLVADIPWFGTSDWLTMYDAPRYLSSVKHRSIVVLWDICTARERIVRNNRSIDKAAQVILSDGPSCAAVDPAMAQSLAARKLGDEDATARAAIARDTLDALDKSGFEAAFTGIPDAQLSPNERAQRNNMRTAKGVLKDVSHQNELLEREVVADRETLASFAGANCVMIGMIATGDLDQVTTPLHSRCPGVVVHATIANAVMRGGWARTAPYWVSVLIVLLTGGLTAVAGARLAPHWAVPATAGLVALFLLVSGYVVFDFFRVRLGLAAPVVAIVGVWAVCTIVRLLIEGIERVRIARDMAVSDHEMDLARRVQQQLLPKLPPKIPGIDCCGWTLAASVTGGDCFDLWQLPDGRLGILVADASGHGLAPSMIVSQVRTLVRVLCDTEPNPGKILDRVNVRLADDLEAGRFVTTFLGFCFPDGRLDWASAGHGPVLWSPSTGAPLQELDTTCLPLGVTADIPQEDSAHLQLEPGGMLIISSDGIFEAPNAAKELYGIERLVNLLKSSANHPPEEIIRRTQEAMLSWQGRTEPHDDQTLVIVRRTAEVEPTKLATELLVEPAAVGS